MKKQTFDLRYFLCKELFINDEAQNYLIFQPLYHTSILINWDIGNSKFTVWKSRCLSVESFWYRSSRRIIHKCSWCSKSKSLQVKNSWLINCRRIILKGSSILAVSAGYWTNYYCLYTKGKKMSILKRQYDKITCKSKIALKH